MLVKDLRNLVSDKPEDMTQEQFDNLPVFIESDDQFNVPDMEKSGIIEFGPLCDLEGNETGEQLPPGLEKVFALIGYPSPVEILEEG